ncbi:MAG: hypothetical protein EAX96_17240 [Candidatus Lokiarchaeota archaeon]|nr:hypothetical protein [Candidatus Lokiarchaeota archaeon]
MSNKSNHYLSLSLYTAGHIDTILHFSFIYNKDDLLFNIEEKYNSINFLKNKKKKSKFKSVFLI